MCNRETRFSLYLSCFLPFFLKKKKKKKEEEEEEKNIASWLR
jgi:hypothetical protein